jgi:hypothetical protein
MHIFKNVIVKNIFIIIVNNIIKKKKFFETYICIINSVVTKIINY